MKASRLIIAAILLVLCNVVCVAKDACEDTYDEAIEAYSKSQYTKAQKLFLIVIQSCGEYADAYELLYKCNTNIADQVKNLSKQVDKLKQDNLLLSSERDNYKSQLEAKSAAYAELTKSNQSSAELRKNYENAQREVSSLKKQLSAANEELKKVQASLEQQKSEDLKAEYEKAKKELESLKMEKKRYCISKKVKFKKTKNYCKDCER